MWRPASSLRESRYSDGRWSNSHSQYLGEERREGRGGEEGGTRGRGGGEEGEEIRGKGRRMGRRERGEEVERRENKEEEIKRGVGRRRGDREGCE